jgi:indolepyruvate decarboxylase
MATQAARAPMHHTLGNGAYDLFRRMTEPVVCGHAVMTPQNAVHETERLIAEALYHRRPVYMAFPADLANQPVLGETTPIAPPRSNPDNLAAAVEAIAATLEKARTACVIAGILVSRTGEREVLQRLINASGLPFSTMLMGKSALDEQHPSYVGIYNGALMNDEVRTFVEGRDCVMLVGAPLTDFNTGAFTARLLPERTIAINHHHVQVGDKRFNDVEMTDLLAALVDRLPQLDRSRIRTKSLGKVSGKDNEPIDAAALYSRWERFLKPDDILVVETGTVSMGLGFALLPSGATFHNQTLWGSIGWATPAAFGAAVAAPDKRVVLVTGDGAHQLTVQEVSQFGRLGLTPVIFVLNNNGYLIERLLCKEPSIAYNDIAPWHYADLAKAFGNDDWLTARVTTCDEFDRALEEAGRSKTGAYIEVVTDAYAASPLALKLHDAVATLYKS